MNPCHLDPFGVAGAAFCKVELQTMRREETAKRNQAAKEVSGVRGELGGGSVFKHQNSTKLEIHGDTNHINYIIIIDRVFYSQKNRI